MEKGMLKSSPGEETQLYYQVKVLSMVVSKMMTFSRRRCCATGTKLGICLRRISLWLHSLQKILVCLSLSSVVLLHRIKILCNLILLQKFTLRVNPRKNLLCCQRKWTGKFLQGKILTRIQTLSQTQSPALILTHGVSLALGRWFLRRNPHWAFRGNFILESKVSYHSGEDISKGTRFKCTSEGWSNSLKLRTNLNKNLQIALMNIKQI